MNKTMTILEKVQLRLKTAEQNAKEARRVSDFGEMIAQKIVDNDVYFYQDPSFNFIIIASLKRIQTIN